MPGVAGAYSARPKAIVQVFLTRSLNLPLLLLSSFSFFSSNLSSFFLSLPSRLVSRAAISRLGAEANDSIRFVGN